MIAVSLGLEGVACRSHRVIGIYELDNHVVFLHSVLGDVPPEQLTKATVFPQYIAADFFSPDFATRTQAFIVYNEKKTLFETCCKCVPLSGGLLLNTMHYQPVGGVFRDHNRQNTLAKLVDISGGSLRETGESPEPVAKLFSESQTHIFGDLAVRMVSPFVMECRSLTANAVVWQLRLSAYLYTDIEEKDGALWFGTAGKGGHLYKVALQNGSIIFACDTGGTVSYIWHKKEVLMRDRKGEIVAIDCETGTEQRRFAPKLPGSRQRLDAMPKMLLSGGKLYFAAHSRKDFYDFYALCIDL